MSNPGFFTQSPDLVSVKTLCKNSGICTAAFDRSALQKDHPHLPSAVPGGEAEYLSAEEAMQKFFLKHTADVFGYLAGTSRTGRSW